jgi:hypothetical protein
VLPGVVFFSGGTIRLSQRRFRMKSSLPMATLKSEIRRTCGGVALCAVIFLSGNIGGGIWVQIGISPGPDGSLVNDVEGYNKWVAGNQAAA